MLLVQERLLGLPNECTTFINIDSNESGIFENELTKDKQQSFKADFIGDLNIKEINKTLPVFKKIKEVIITTEPLEKTTTGLYPLKFPTQFAGFAPSSAI